MGGSREKGLTAGVVHFRQTRRASPVSTTHRSVYPITMRHILIVDADVRAANAMAGVAASLGFTSATARSLREAHGQIALQAPGIAFVDQQLPDGNGMSLLEQGGPLAAADVVLLTQRPTFDTSIEALRLHAA